MLNTLNTLQAGQGFVSFGNLKRVTWPGAFSGS